MKYNKFKVGEKVILKEDKKVYTIYALYPKNKLSLGLYEYPDTEQDYLISIADIEKIDIDICLCIALDLPHGERRTAKEIKTAIQNKENTEHDYFKELYKEICVKAEKGYKGVNG